MNTQTGLDPRAAAWLADGPTELADRVLDAALREVHVTKQRHAVRAPWRFHMPVSARVAAGAATVALLMGGLLYLGVLGPTPTPTPGPSATPAPAASIQAPIDTSAWASFTSPAYGYTAAVPASWEGTFGTLPNTVDAFLGADQADSFLGSSHPYLSAWSVELPADVSTEAWISTYLGQANSAEEPCFPQPEAWARVTVDGQQGWRYAGCNGWEEAMIVVQRRAYVFSAFDGRQPDAAAPFLAAFLTTVRLHPEDALRGDATNVPFQSSLHHYAVQIPSTWVARAATEPWLEGTRVGRDQANVDLFTPGVTIGNSAYVAAQPVEPGTSLDAWVAAWVGTREELDGFCSYSGSGWEAATLDGLQAQHRPMLCTGGAFDTPGWDQYAIVIGDRGYVIAGTPSMVERLLASFAGS